MGLRSELGTDLGHWAKLLDCCLHTCTPCFHLVAAEVMGTGENQMPITREGGRWTQNLEAGTIVMYPGLEQFYRDSKGFCCATVFMEDLSGIVGVWYIIFSFPLDKMVSWKRRMHCAKNCLSETKCNCEKHLDLLVSKTCSSFVEWNQPKLLSGKS